MAAGFKLVFVIFSSVDRDVLYFLNLGVYIHVDTDFESLEHWELS